MITQPVRALRQLMRGGGTAMIVCSCVPGLLELAPDSKAARSPRATASPIASATPAAAAAAVGVPSSAAGAGAVATAAIPKQPPRNAPLISPYSMDSKLSTLGSAAAKDKSPITSPSPSQTATAKPVATIAVAADSAAAKQGITSAHADSGTQSPPLPDSVSQAVGNSSDLPPVASAKPAAFAQPQAAPAQQPAATAQPQVGPAQQPAATAQPQAAPAQQPAGAAQLPFASAQATASTAQPPNSDTAADEAAADIYSPIRSPPAVASTPSSLPTVARLPVPQLGPLPPALQPHYQQADSNTSMMPYATAEQVAAWQQQQAYPGYYGGTYPYPDPNYGYAYSQTQPYSGYGVASSAPMGLAGPQPPAGVPPPRPPPLGPNSPPPKHPLGRPPASSSLPGALAGQQGPAPLTDPAPPASSSVPSSSAALPWAQPGGTLPYVAPAPSSAAAAADGPAADVTGEQISLDALLVQLTSIADVITICLSCCSHKCLPSYISHAVPKHSMWSPLV